MTMGEERMDGNIFCGSGNAGSNVSSGPEKASGSQGRITVKLTLRNSLADLDVIDHKLYVTAGLLNCAET